jgi:hypothetical protein
MRNQEVMPYLMAAITGAATLGIPTFLHRNDLFLGYLPTIGPIVASVGGALAGVGIATLPNDLSIKAIYLVGVDSIGTLTDAWYQLMQIGAFASKPSEYLTIFKKEDYGLANVTIIVQNNINQALNQTSNHLSSVNAVDTCITDVIETKQDSLNNDTLRKQNYSVKNNQSFSLILYTDLNNVRNNEKIDMTNNQFAQFNTQITELNRKITTLDRRITNLNTQIQKNNKKIIRGIASAAALSSAAILMPGKTAIEAGVSRYEQEQALAITVSYRPILSAVNVQGSIAAAIGSKPAMRLGANYEF